MRYNLAINTSQSLVISNEALYCDQDLGNSLKLSKIKKSTIQRNNDGYLLQIQAGKRSIEMNVDEQHLNAVEANF